MSRTPIWGIPILRRSSGRMALHGKRNEWPLAYNLKTEGHFKDAFHEYVVRANSAAVNPAHAGTKTAAHIIRNVPAGSSVEARACLRAISDGIPFEGFDDVMRTRRAKAD